MAGGPDDYYALLGVAPGASDAELRRVWRELAIRWHPDRAGPDATWIFQRIAIAYQVLSDPAARAAYDRKHGITAAPGAPSAPDAAAEPLPRKAPGVLIRRLSSPLDVLLACGIARRVEDDVIELALNAEEAAEGGMVTIAMRVPVRSDTGEIADDLFAAWLAIRPGVADGTLLKPSAQLPGVLRPVMFRVRLGAAR